MHQPVRLPENFDQILAEHPCSGISHRTPPPPPMKNSNFLSWVQIWAYTEHPSLKMKNFNFLSWVQIWAYTEHPPSWKWKTLTFFPEFRSEPTQNTPPPKMKNSNFLSWVQIWAYTEHPPPPTGSWSMWRLYPPRIPSRCQCYVFVKKPISSSLWWSVR